MILQKRLNVGIVEIKTGEAASFDCLDIFYRALLSRKMDIFGLPDDTISLLNNAKSVILKCQK